VADRGGGISVVLHRGSNCLLSRTMDDSIMRHGTTSLCQSAATSKIVKHCCSQVFSCKQRYIKYSYLHLLPLPITNGWFAVRVCTGQRCLPFDAVRVCTGQRCLPFDAVRVCTGQRCSSKSSLAVRVCTGQRCLPFDAVRVCTGQRCLPFDSL